MTGEPIRTRLESTRAAGKKAHHHNMTDSPASNTAPANLEELARVHDLAFPLLAALRALTEANHQGHIPAHLWRTAHELVTQADA